MKLSLFASLLSCVLLSCSIVGCSKDTSSGGGKATPSIAAAPELVPFLLKDAPQGSAEVGAARTAAKDGESIIVSGRFREFVDGIAAFTLVDSSLPACGEGNGEEPGGCATPWDFCCEDPDTLAAKTASVALEKDGAPLVATLKGVAGIDHLTRCVVRGKAKVDAQGNLTIVADGIYVAANG